MMLEVNFLIGLFINSFYVTLEIIYVNWEKEVWYWKDVGGKSRSLLKVYRPILIVS
jgi:hypothetical protein